MATKTPRTDALWRAFTDATGLAGVDYVVVCFGDGPGLATELAALVVAGRKRATCSLVRDYDGAPQSVPKVGDHVVVVDGAGQALCIWRTTEVTIKPMIEVDDAFAWDEGEGDRSRDDWLRLHRLYFARVAKRDGFEMDDRLPAVFERFEIVWPRLQ